MKKIEKIYDLLGTHNIAEKIGFLILFYSEIPVCYFSEQIFVISRLKYDSNLIVNLVEYEDHHRKGLETLFECRFKNGRFIVTSHGKIIRKCKTEQEVLFRWFIRRGQPIFKKLL